MSEMNSHKTWDDDENEIKEEEESIGTLEEGVSEDLESVVDADDEIGSSESLEAISEEEEDYQDEPYDDVDEY